MHSLHYQLSSTHMNINLLSMWCHIRHTNIQSEIHSSHGQTRAIYFFLAKTRAIILVLMFGFGARILIFY